MQHSTFPRLYTSGKMPNQKMATENSSRETRQLIGSSKRKRKSSIIKHNVMQNDKSNDADAFTKPVRTYAKKTRTERGKMGKDKAHNEPGESPTRRIPEKEEKKFEKELDGESISEESTNVNNENATEETNTKVDGSSEDVGETKQSEGNSSSLVSDGQCSSTAQQCQNCTFCPEHKPGNGESDVKEDYVSKTYTCEVCAGLGLKRVYNSMDKFKKHTKEVHEPKKDVKRFECTDCPEPVWFPTKSKYCYHIRAKHPGVIKFVCDVCTQTFKLKANYKNHIKTHNLVVQKKFSCDVCGGTFVNRSSYLAHKNRFPGPHIKQSCAHCGISFSKEKHMKNHRCKILLLEEAAAARDISKSAETEKVEKASEEQAAKESKAKQDLQQSQTDLTDKNPAKEGTSEEVVDAGNKKEATEGDQSGKRVLFHRLLPKKNEKMVYKQLPLQTQNVTQPVVVQEFREIDIEGSALITAEPDHQIILRDVNGHVFQGNQILQLDINDFHPGEESQVYLTDWNVVAPFVIRGKSP